MLFTRHRMPGLSRDSSCGHISRGQKELVSGVWSSCAIPPSQLSLVHRDPLPWLGIPNVGRASCVRPVTGLACQCITLLLNTTANSAKSPAQLHRVLHLPFPQSSLAGGGLPRTVTQEESEKEKPLKIVTCPVYAIKGHKKGTRLAINNILQVFTDVQKDYTLSIHSLMLTTSTPVSSGSVQKEFRWERQVLLPFFLSTLSFISADFSKIFFLLVPEQF